MPLEIPESNQQTQEPGVGIAIPGSPISTTNIAASTGMTGQSSARNRELANLLGVPQPVFDADETVAQQTWDGLKSNVHKEYAPYTHDLMNQNPDSFATYKDDEDDLSLMEYLVRGGGAVLGGGITAIGQIPGGLSRLFSLAHDTTLDAFIAPFNALNPELGASIKEAVTSPVPFAPWWTNPEIGLEELGDAIKETGEEFTPEDPNFIEEVLGGVGQMASQMAVLLATGGVGGTVALFAQGTDITGEKLEATRKEGEKEEKWEGFAAALGGGVTAVTEKYGLDLLMKRIPASTRSRFVRILKGAGTEATQEVLEEVGQNLVIMGFDKDRVPETTIGGLAHQGAVAGTVGAIAGALIPRSKRALQTDKLMTDANEISKNLQVTQNNPKAAISHRVEAVKGAGIDGAAIKLNVLVDYAKKNPEDRAFISALAPKISASLKRDSKKVMLSAQEFAEHIFDPVRFDKLSDHLEYFTTTNRVGITPAEAVDQIKERRTALIEKAEKEKDPTLRQRTLTWLDKFVEQEDVDLKEILRVAPSDVVVRVENYLAEINTEELQTETQIREKRAKTIGDRLSEIETQINTLEDNILLKKDKGKGAKRDEKKLDKLKREERLLRAEETLLKPILPVQEKNIPRVQDKKPVATRAEELRRLNVKSSRETEREARKAFRAARSAARKDIKDAQNIARSFIENSGLSLRNKGKYVTTISNIDSIEKLEEVLPRLQERVLEDITRQRTAQVKGAIEKVVKKGVKANTSPAVNDLLKQAKKILGMKVKDAKAMLDDDAVVAELDPMLIGLLGVKANSSQVDVDYLEKILFDLDHVIEGGRAIGVANVLHRTAQREELRQRLKEAIGPAPQETLSQTQEAVQAGLVYTFLGTSGSWRNKLQHIFSAKKRDNLSQVVYHGTRAKFDKFDPKVSDSIEGQASFFSSNLATAEVYANESRGREEPRVEKRKLDLTKFDTVDMKGELYDPDKAKVALDKAKKAGKDGVIFKNVENDYYDYSQKSQPRLPNHTVYAVLNNKAVLPEHTYDVDINQLLSDLSLFKESREYDVNTRKTADRFQQLAMERTGLKARELLKRWNRDNTEVVTLGPFTMADGRSHTLKLTKAQMRMAHMQALNQDIKNSFEDPSNDGGYTEAVWEGIQSEMDEYDRQMIEAQLEFYDEYYERINSAYRRNYGLNLPKVEHYVPVRRDFGDENATEEFLRSILYRGGPKPASLQARKKGAKQRVKRASDITTLQSHMAEMEYFIAYAEKVNTLMSVFSGSNNEIMNLIADRYGRKVAGVIQEDLRWFANKGAMQGSAIDQILNQLMRNFGFAQLGAKPQIGLKQLASFSAFAQDVDTIQFVKAITELATPKGWREAQQLLNKSSFFRERGMNFDNDFKDLAKDTHNNKLLNFMGTHPKFTRIMMLPIRYGDKGAILIGGYAHVKAAMAAGKSESEALDSFARLANSTQQSSDPDQLASLQRTSAMGRIWAQFLSSANAVARAEYEAISEFAKGRLSKQEFAKRMLIYHFIIPNTIMFIGNGFEWETEDQVKASVIGALTGLIVLGDVIEFAGNLAVGNDRPFDIEGRHPFSFMQSLFDAIRGDWDMDFADIIDGSKTLERLFEFGGALTGIPMEALYNILRGTAVVTEAALEGKPRALEEGGKLMLGYSPYTIEHKD